MRLRTIFRVHTEHEDAVLAQDTYLSPAQLHDLELSHGIKASTVFQHEGEAIFIPAGCVHQVIHSIICFAIIHDIKGIG
jgi:hypothetical protein